MLILGPPLRLGLLGEQGSSPAQPAINAQPNRVMLVQLCMVSVHQNSARVGLVRPVNFVSKPIKNWQNYSVQIGFGPRIRKPGTVRAMH